MCEEQQLLITELRRIFNYPDFKSKVQKSATEAVYKRDKDVFICMPSGAGKSLCFLLPAVLQDRKVAIVICPSLSLIQDQVTSLKRFKIRVRCINSKMTSSQKRFLMSDLQADSPRMKILYVTPETALDPTFARLLLTICKLLGLNYTARTTAQTECTQGLVPVIVATSAFGIGIDRGSVRFVVHWTVPQSIATYYQESGCAGRDEAPAFCRIYVSNFEMGAIRLSFAMRDHRNMTQAAIRQKNCNNQCDCCKNKSQVGQMIKEFNRTVRKQPVYLPYGLTDSIMDYDEEESETDASSFTSSSTSEIEY